VVWDLCDRLKKVEKEVALSPDKLKYRLVLVSVRGQTGLIPAFSDIFSGIGLIISHHHLNLTSVFINPEAS
jgi:hypothetical protein